LLAKRAAGRAPATEVVDLDDNNPRLRIVEAEMNFDGAGNLDGVGRIARFGVGDGNDRDYFTDADDLMRRDNRTWSGLHTFSSARAALGAAS
jgi:hypothetical protein